MTIGSWSANVLLCTQVPLKIVHREAPVEIHAQRLYHVYHRGDVAKMQILLQYGGIYLDYDVIVVNSLDPVRRYDATLGNLLTELTAELRKTNDFQCMYKVGQKWHHFCTPYNFTKY